VTAVVQRSFAGGEISPQMRARVDLVKYATGLEECRNFIVRKSGGISDRPGTQFIADGKFPTRTVRLVRFVFNNSQTYALEFGHLYMRVYKAGVQQRLASVASHVYQPGRPRRR